MKYFELEESRLKNLLKMEKVWEKDKEQEGEVKVSTNCTFRNTVMELLRYINV